MTDPPLAVSVCVSAVASESSWPAGAYRIRASDAELFRDAGEEVTGG